MVEWSPGDYFSLAMLIVVVIFIIYYLNQKRKPWNRVSRVQPFSDGILLQSDLKF